MVEVGECSGVPGAREPGEETTLETDPGDLGLFDPRTFAKVGEIH